ncbi:hypothetical protein PVAP13_8KG256201 [Panicum virgatum]|uniref:Uncharacterized protein n=1 Tax=Panicum virgatum TaxID=38727 RepID=A0A8T0PP06_PANVG|nr:hypothetical protein PVAP13_8KG256201 [Panicum virgatum]
MAWRGGQRSVPMARLCIAYVSANGEGRPARLLWRQRMACATSAGMDGDRRARTAGGDERQLSGRGRARRSSARAGRRASAASGRVDGRRRRPVREEARRRGHVGTPTPTGRTAREASGGRVGARKGDCRAARLTHGSDGGERRWRASPKEDGGGRRRRSCGTGVDRMGRREGGRAPGTARIGGGRERRGAAAR